MYSPYNERCKGCPFAGRISDQVKSGNFCDLRFVECLRDNEDAKDKFKHSGKKEDLELWNSQEGNFQHCIYYYENFNIFRKS